MAFFVIFGQKMRFFFSDGGSEKLNNLLQKTCITRFSESTTLKIGYGAL